jgi:hypothetical protein
VVGVVVGVVGGVVVGGVTAGARGGIVGCVGPGGRYISGGSGIVVIGGVGCVGYVMYEPRLLA